MGHLKKILRYLAFLSERIPSYIFPIFLLLVEWFLRSAFNVSTQEFIGPTLAAAGAGMVISLTTYKSSKNQEQVLNNSPIEITPELRQYLSENELKLEPSGISAVRVFINVCWTITLFLTLLWMWSIVLSTQSPNMNWGSFPAHYYPGAASYVIGLILSEVKEII